MSDKSTTSTQRPDEAGRAEFAKLVDAAMVKHGIVQKLRHENGVLPSELESAERMRDEARAALLSAIDELLPSASHQRTPEVTDEKIVDAIDLRDTVASLAIEYGFAMTAEARGDMPERDSDVVYDLLLNAVKHLRPSEEVTDAPPPKTTPDGYPSLEQEFDALAEFSATQCVGDHRCPVPHWAIDRIVAVIRRPTATGEGPSDG